MNTLDYAMKMEYDGEKYYREQAELNKDNGLYVVCNLLAEEEKNHARVLENKKKHLAYNLHDSDFLTNAKNVYTGSKGIEVEETNYPSQLDFYRNVCEMEQKSIDLYQKFLSDATEEDRKLFEYLINQEKQHLEAFEEMSRLLQNAEWWIESPEFGRRREEY
ncbi:MAG: ferritin family protein [Herbinix sp.]|nr:ferritin family protein [Herbinix sp.]